MSQVNDDQQVKSTEKDGEELSEEQLKSVAGGVKPPSGDSNPSDLGNSTVDTGDVTNPHPAK